MRLPAVDLPAPMKPTRDRSTRCPMLAQGQPRVSAGASGLSCGSRSARGRRERPEDVVDVVAAELLAVGAGEDEREHRLTDDARRRDHGGVGALLVGLLWLLRVHVDGPQRLRQGRNRLDRYLHDQGFAVRHAALDAAGAIGLAVVAALGRVEDLIVGLGAGAGGDLPRGADADPLDRLDRDHGLSDSAVELLLPGDVRAEAGHEPQARTSKVPPRLSFSFRRRLISPTIAAEALGRGSGPGRRRRRRSPRA